MPPEEACCCCGLAAARVAGEVLTVVRGCEFVGGGGPGGDAGLGACSVPVWLSHGHPGGQAAATSGEAPAGGGSNGETGGEFGAEVAGLVGLTGMGGLSVTASLVGEEGTGTRDMKSSWESPHLGHTKVRDWRAIFRRSSGGQSSEPMAP